ncbi:hypothetical protein FOA52_005172 [Chlamydomonas sp. UWO 241]|nr:hypothetical protein FOA52_005172 [Chlamydomonas sp. UWO 241]
MLRPSARHVCITGHRQSSLAVHQARRQPSRCAASASDGNDLRVKASSLGAALVLCLGGGAGPAQALNVPTNAAEAVKGAQYAVRAAPVQLLLPSVQAAPDTRSSCSATDTGFSDPKEQAIACYTGNFLVKMLSELNSGEAKTVEHVRVHLLPYLGGPAALKALATDDIRPANCTLCYSADDGTINGLRGLRESLRKEEIKAYDDLEVCHHTLTNRIMERLPQDDAGLFLQGNKEPGHDSFKQAMNLLREMFRSANSPLGALDVRSCRVRV